MMGLFGNTRPSTIEYTRPASRASASPARGVPIDIPKHGQSLKEAVFGSDTPAKQTCRGLTTPTRYLLSQPRKVAPIVFSVRRLVSETVEG
jgi:hypothetical protein